MESYPSNIGEIYTRNAALIVFSFIPRENSASSGGVADSCIMPVPKDLNNPMDIKWEQSELGQLANAVVGKEPNGSVSDSAANLGVGVVKKLATTAGMSEGKARAIEGLSTGRYANPYMAMTFQHIGFRRFSMEFKFTPHNSGECASITNIIKMFRKHALPIGGARIGYPSEIDISYEGTPADWLPRFKRAVIEDVQISYSGQGNFATIADNGFPVETIMSLKFAENTLVFSEDVALGY